jgi:hypothetical protein
MGQSVPGNRQAIMASSHRWKSSGAPPRKTSPRGRTSSHTTKTMPGGGPQTDTIAITQGHLPHTMPNPRPQRRSLNIRVRADVFARQSGRAEQPILESQRLSVVS